MNEAEYWEKLGEIGWLEHLSDRERKQIRSTLKKNLMAKDRRDWAFLALTQGGFDAEDIDYPRELAHLAAMSRNLFKPTAISEKVVSGKRAISFLHNNKSYRVIVADNGWFDDAFLDTANRALEQSRAKERFIVLPAVDQFVNLVFVPTKVYDAAVREKLIPREEDLPDEEEEFEDFDE